MGKLKKLMGLMLTLLMIISTVKPTFAQGTNSLTIENTGKTPHYFELYQIFTGEVSQEEGKMKLSNIQWGDGVKDPVGVASEKAEALKSEADAEKFAKEISLKLQNPNTSSEVSVGEKHLFDNLQEGYYLVKDVESIQSDEIENSAHTLYILKVVGKVEAKTKLDVPSVIKHVKDINDSDDKDYKDWAKTADHDIGDKVPFKLTGTLPSNFDKYETYKYVFHDEGSIGLTFQEDSIKVYAIKNQDKINLMQDNDYKITTSGNNFDLTFENLKTNKSITKEHKIVVEYTAKLNDQAVIGSKGNPNEVYLEYSNNPNKSGDGTGKTPKDKVIVFTYKVIVNKTDGKNPLKGAAFKLEKFNLGNNKYELVKEIEAGENTTFEFKGIDDGKYKLTETKKPPGFNKIQPIEFNVVATHEDDPLKLTDLNGNAIEGTIQLTMTKDVTNGSLSTDIVNKQGPELPETGGMGTKIIYTVGTVLVLGGVIYLVTKRKLSINR